MKFQESKDYFGTLSDALSVSSRRELLDRAASSLKSLKQILFEFDVDEIFMTDSFLDKNVYSMKNLTIYFEVNQKDLAKIIDRRLLEDLKNLDFLISDKKHLYFLTDGRILLKDNLEIKTISLGPVWNLIENI